MSVDSVRSQPSFTRQYFSAVSSGECSVASVAAKVFILAIPIILLVTIALDCLSCCSRSDNRLEDALNYDRPSQGRRRFQQLNQDNARNLSRQRSQNGPPALQMGPPSSMLGQQRGPFQEQAYVTDFARPDPRLDPRPDPRIAQQSVYTFQASGRIPLELQRESLNSTAVRAPIYSSGTGPHIVSAARQQMATPLAQPARAPHAQRAEIPSAARAPISPSGIGPHIVSAMGQQMATPLAQPSRAPQLQRGGNPPPLQSRSIMQIGAPQNGFPSATNPFRLQPSIVSQPSDNRRPIVQPQLQPRTQTSFGPPPNQMA